MNGDRTLVQRLLTRINPTLENGLHLDTKNCREVLEKTGRGNRTEREKKKVDRNVSWSSPVERRDGTKHVKIKL